MRYILAALARSGFFFVMIVLAGLSTVSAHGPPDVRPQNLETRTAKSEDAAISEHHKINYIEFNAADLEAEKSFYAGAFGWTFQDWGPDYVSFEGAGVAGGIERRGPAAADKGDIGAGALVILYSDDLKKSVAAVTSAGGKIVQDIFEFPGGRRFHFRDPGGNELAVWSDQPVD